MAAARIPQGISACRSLRPTLPRPSAHLCESVDDAGGELYALKDILGHKTIAMTQRYAHLSPAYKRAMVDRMEQIWAKPGIRQAEIPVPENRRRLLKQHTHATKTAAAVNA